MCFIIVYSVVAAVVAGDMGAIACAAPAEENEVGFTGATPGFYVQGWRWQSFYTLHHMFVAAWRA